MSQEWPSFAPLRLRADIRLETRFLWYGGCTNVETRRRQIHSTVDCCVVTTVQTPRRPRIVKVRQEQQIKMNYVIVIGLIIYAAASPLKTEEKRSIPDGYYGTNSVTQNVKKDVFISRGWGAGGMPFSVLYMTPHSSKAPFEQGYKMNQVVAKPKIEGFRPKAAHVSVRNSMGSLSRPGGRKSYSIIPQLFVSYGWGPAGK